jgi:hypothetical protein
VREGGEKLLRSNGSLHADAVTVSPQSTSTAQTLRKDLRSASQNAVALGYSLRSWVIRLNDRSRVLLMHFART